MITASTLFRVLTNLLLALVLFVSCGYLYSRFFEDPYLSYKNMPFVVKGPLYEGSAATIPILRCNSKSTTQKYSTTRFIQKIGITQLSSPLPSLTLTVEPGCETVINRINLVPEGTPLGWYRFGGVASVQGLFVTHEVEWTTDPFEVVEKPVGKP